MSNRYAVSGAVAAALDGTTTLTGEPLIGRELTTGRVLWLRSAWFHSASTTSGEVPLALIDATAGVAATGTTRRFNVICATGRTTQVDFPAPGLKFSTGCCVLKEATTVSSAFAGGSCGGCGYEE